MRFKEQISAAFADPARSRFGLHTFLCSIVGVKAAKCLKYFSLWNHFNIKISPTVLVTN